MGFDRVRLVAFEFGPDASERKQRTVLAERESDHGLLFGRGVWVGRIFRKAVGRRRAPALRLEPTPPMRRGRVPNVLGENHQPVDADMPQRIVTIPR